MQYIFMVIEGKSNFWGLFKMFGVSKENMHGDVYGSVKSVNFMLWDPNLIFMPKFNSEHIHLTEFGIWVTSHHLIVDLRVTHGSTMWHP